MVRFLNVASPSGETIDSTAAFTVVGPGNISTPSGDAIANATTDDVSSIKTVPSSGLFIIGSGQGQWSYASGILDPSQGSGTIPTAISGLIAWYDAIDSQVSLTGSGVTQWNDKSGNDYHLNNNDGPPNKGDDGGVSGMLMNGTNALFIPTSTHPAFDFSGNDTPHTIVVAYRQVTAHNGALFSWNSSIEDATNIAGFVNSGGVFQYFRRKKSGTTANISLVEPVTDPTVAAIGTWLFDGTQISMYCSGVAVTTAASGADVEDLGNLTLNGFGGLNRFGFGKSNFWNGWLYSIAMWNRELTSEERIAVEKNFATRYGISMSDYEDNQ